jgi:hypothetical protein
MRPYSSVLSFFILASTVFLAQTQAPAPRPQTAREALVEIITGGPKSLTKHLTVEVQDLLNKPENKQGAAMLAMFNAVQQQSGSDMQSFSTGTTLFTVNEPAQHKKLEVRIDNDDLSGDQDVLQLSLHSLRDGQEQRDEQDEWGLMSSHITVTMKRQENIWRLSDVGVGIDLPLGDPEFLKKTFLKGAGGAATGLGATASGAEAASVTVQHETKNETPRPFDPSGMVAMLGYSESAFARQHPDIGFTCSLAELADASKAFGLDQQIASGSYMGYKWSLSGCEGKPAGSFQIVAEPIAQGRGAKAICTDATQNVRVADDGRGSTCLSTGKVNALQGESDGMIGFKIDTDPNQPKP